MVLVLVLVLEEAGGGNSDILERSGLGGLIEGLMEKEDRERFGSFMVMGKGRLVLILLLL